MAAAARSNLSASKVAAGESPDSAGPVAQAQSLSLVTFGPRSLVLMAAQAQSAVKAGSLFRLGSASIIFIFPP